MKTNTIQHNEIYNNSNKEKITVGKFTLESLTTGMYSEPMTIYREYIQNACDSIDMAVRAGILNIKAGKGIKDCENGQIFITINEEKREIIIKDNGTGIPLNNVRRILGDIGRSEKTFNEQRGFRGIGRLGGMSYCDELTFETSFKGEDKKSIVNWNCKDLKDYLRPGEYEEYDLSDVMEKIWNQKVRDEQPEKHYFIVHLRNVSEKYMELLDESKVKSYISQTAPIPFDPQRFIYANSIKKDFEKYGYEIPEYSVFLNDNPNRLTKLYKSRVVSRKDREKEKNHEIIKYEIIKSNSIGDKKKFIGWIGRRHKYEETIQIKDKEVSGIRIRKGNIQIGNNEILKDFFSEDRYNHYFIGEIHILSYDTVPNARRDNFEKTGDYPLILDDLEIITRDLSKQIRINSEEKSINNEVQKASETVNLIKEQAKKGFSSKIEQDEAFCEIDNIKNKMETLKNKKIDNTIVDKAQEISAEIQEMENTIINGKCDNFIAKNISSKYGRKEKKIICKVLEIIDTIAKENPKTDNDFICLLKKRILDEFK